MFHENNFKYFKFEDIFEFERGKRLIRENQIDGEIPFISSFSIIILPSVFCSSPEIIESKVDFPHPLGPIILTNSPFLTSRLKSLKSFFSP